MKTQKRPMTRLEVLVLIAIFAVAALLVVGILDLYCRYFGESSQRPTLAALPSRSASRSV
jgi:hypothetical protein